MEEERQKSSKEAKTMLNWSKGQYLTLLDFNLHYKVTVTKTVKFCMKEDKQTNGTGHRGQGSDIMATNS